MIFGVLPLSLIYLAHVSLCFSSMIVRRSLGFSYLNINLMWVLFFQIFITWQKDQFGVTIKRFRSNNAKDYFNQVLTPYFRHEGIIHESSCVNTPQQNGVTEKKNDHLLDTIRAFLFPNHVSKSYWGQVVLTATHLINRLPFRVLCFKSPMEVLSSFYPNMRTTNHLILFTLQAGENWTQEQSNLFLWDISQLKRDTSVTIHNSKFFFSKRMLPSMKVSYFPTSYLQGKNFFKEDKDWDSYFIDPFSINPPKVISLVLVPSASLPVPKLELSPIEPTKNRMTGKVYSRKKDAVPKPIQV